MAELLPYHDPVKHTFYDMAHMFANVIKGSLSATRDKAKSKGGDRSYFPGPMRAFEHGAERLQNGARSSSFPCSCTPTCVL
jgi:hypothetical protein